MPQPGDEKVIDITKQQPPGAVTHPSGRKVDVYGFLGANFLETNSLETNSLETEPPPSSPLTALASGYMRRRRRKHQQYLGLVPEQQAQPDKREVDSAMSFLEANAAPKKPTCCEVCPSDLYFSGTGDSPYGEPQTERERLQQRLRALDVQPASAQLASKDSGWPRSRNYRTYKYQKPGLLF